MQLAYEAFCEANKFEGYTHKNKMWIIKSKAQKDTEQPTINLNKQPQKC
jgi:hypothetical protein